MSINFDDLQAYFNESMEYLSEQGKAFANQYPEISNSLGLETKDPDIKRLLESFAFFDARMNLNIDNQKDVVTNFLINALCPEILSIIPSACIIELDHTSISKELTIPKDTQVKIQNFDGKNCIFQTTEDHKTYRCTILEVTLLETSKDPNLDHIKWKYSLIIEFDFETLYNKIPIYINTDHDTASKLLQNILCVDSAIRVFDYATQQQIGFISIDKFRLIELNNPFAPVYEYSMLKENMHFFELNLDVNKITNKCRLVIPVASNLSITTQITRPSLLINCIPVVNLFKKKSDPIKINLCHHEHEIVSDIENDFHGIYAVKNVSAFDSRAGKEINREDFFIRNQNNRFFLSLKQDNINLADQIIYADLLCSNYGYAESISLNSKVYITQLNQVSAKIVAIQNKPKKLNDSNKWTLLSLFYANNFYSKNYDFVKLIDTVMNLFNITEFHRKISIKNYHSYGVSSTNWKGLFSKNIFEIDIRDNVRDSFIYGLLLAEVFMNISDLHSLCEVRIKSGESLFIVSEST